MCTLNVISGPATGQTLEIEQEIVIGREGADVTIADAEMSRRHAVLRPLDDGVEVEDLGSLNGTFVDEKKLDAPARLSGNVVLRMGTSRIELTIEEEAEEPAAEIPQPDVTAPRAIHDPDVTAPRAIPEPDVTAPRAIPDPDVTAPRAIPDPDVTAPRAIPEPDVTAPRAIPDPDVTAPRAIPEPDVTAPRAIPDPDVTAPRQIPQPDVTAKRDVVGPTEGSPPVPTESTGPSKALLVGLGVALVALLVVLVLLLA